ncbi:MAG: shikimate kinase [Phycisphaerales bacterium JB063]
MNIILFGYRGCGKTTLGQLLARKLWKEFADTDDLARKRFDGLDIAAIWEQFGEPAFRQAEVEATMQALASENHVIALGGGTLMQPAAREAIAGASDVKRIYLACSPTTLLERINADAGTGGQRPSLTGGGSATDGGLAEIERILAQRDPVYRAAADAVFDVTFCTPEQAVGHLVKLV